MGNKCLPHLSRRRRMSIDNDMFNIICKKERTLPWLMSKTKQLVWNLRRARRVAWRRDVRLKKRNKKRKVRKHQLFISASRFNIQEAIFGSSRDVCRHFRDINTIQKKKKSNKTKQKNATNIDSAYTHMYTYT